MSSINATYHFDDSHSVESNLAVRSLKEIPSFWLDNKTSSFIPENRVYRPLVYTFYSICWLIGGGQTWPFHVMKMVMHMLVALALFAIWRRLWREPGWFPVKNLKIKFPFVSHVFPITPEWAAFFLAALFAVHPATSECAVYISATTSLQCAMFYVWAYLFYLQFRDSGDQRRLALALLFYFLSVASKEEGITLVAMVFFTEIFLLQGGASQRIGRALRVAAPFAALFVALLGWYLSMRSGEGDESRGVVSPLHYFFTQWRAYLWYMRLWFWPWELNADSASIVFSLSATEPYVIQAAIGNVLVILFAWMNRKRFPAMLFGLVWFYVTISPASSVIPLAEAINEHRMYLSYVGFVGGTFTVFLFCAEAFFTPETRARRLGWLYAAIAVGLVIGTQERNRVWLNDENLWADTVEKNPTSGRALNNLSLVYLGRGEYARSLEFLNRCEQHWPTYMYCRLNQGIAYQSLNKIPEAEKAFQIAYQLNPRSVHVNFHMGRFYQESKKECGKAIEHYRAAVDNQGGKYPAADINLSACLIELKRTQEARQALQRALAAEPGNTQALFNLGRVELDSQNPGAAEQAYRGILAVDPRNVQAWYNLGVAKLAMRAFTDAKYAFEQTIQMDPKSEQGWYNLAFSLDMLREGGAAIEAARKLASINPEKPEYKLRLSELERKYGPKK